MFARVKSDLTGLPPEYAHLNGRVLNFEIADDEDSGEIYQYRYPDSSRLYSFYKEELDFAPSDVTYSHEAVPGE